MEESNGNRRQPHAMVESLIFTYESESVCENSEEWWVSIVWSEIFCLLTFVIYFCFVCDVRVKRCCVRY